MPPRKSAAQVTDDQLGFDALGSVSEVAPPKRVVEAVPEPDPAPEPEPTASLPAEVVEFHQGISVGEAGGCEPHGLIDCPACFLEEPEPEPEPIPAADPAPAPAVVDPTTTAALFDAAPDPTVLSRSIIDEYTIPPFSFFDTRQGYWQDRKRLWVGLGIKSEIGRDEKLTYGKFNQDYEAKTRAAWEALEADTSLTDEEKDRKRQELAKAGALNPHTVKRYGGGSTSVFDPVLTEIMYRWLCPPQGAILDPFAGGSVRGIVAACLGYQYVGVELRDVQVSANREQAKDILRPGTCTASGDPIPSPIWVEGDSDKVLATDTFGYDFVFTCPPYADLEVYSDHPADISNMAPDKFDEVYSRIITRSAKLLSDNRFGVVVISNVRDKRGHIRDLCRLTTEAMAAGGAALYNDIILLNVSGTGALRVRKQFDTSRKLVRVHQYVMVYVKGDPREAAKVIGSQS